MSHAVTTEFRIAGTRGLQTENNFVCGREGRTRLVGEKYSFMLKKINNFRISSINNSFQCLFKRMGSFFPTAKDWGSIGIVRKQMSYSLELKAVKFENKSFTRMHPSVQSIHLQMDNLVAFSCLVKIGGEGGTHNKVLSYISKEIWDYLMAKVITITAE